MNWLNLIISNKQLVEIAGHNNGARNIGVIKIHINELSQQGFFHEQVVKMIKFDNGYKNIEALHAALREFVELNLSVNEIVKIVAKRNGFRNIEKAKNDRLISMRHDMRGILAIHRQKSLGL